MLIKKFLIFLVMRLYLRIFILISLSPSALSFCFQIGKKIVLVDLTVLANNLTNIASSIRAASSSAEVTSDVMA